MINVFLVVVSMWQIPHRGTQIMPALVQQMPSMKACEAVLQTLKDLANVTVSDGPFQGQCIEVRN